MRQMCVGAACMDTSRPVDSFLHRARSASRSKPLPRAVGGSRRFTGKVDKSATGSVNFLVPLRLGSPAMHLRPPAFDHGIISFAWALFFGLFVWIGGSAGGLGRAAAFTPGRG